MKQIKAMILTLAFTIVLPAFARADLSPLIQVIITVNREDLRASLKDGTYRGEAGILRMRPEVAQAMGLEVFYNNTYREADALFKEMRQIRGRIEALFATDSNQGVVRDLARLAARYNNVKRLAREKYLLYGEELKQASDERLDEASCTKLMKRLLSEALSQYSNRLRDSLAHFYNVCQGLEEGPFPLTVENVRFVNRVVRALELNGGPQALTRYKLDHQRPEGEWKGDHGWASILEEKARPFARELQGIIAEGSNPHTIDPLFIMALIKRESSFEPRAVSDVGAVGLMQIMPATAKGLGLKFIYEPGYLDKARNLLAREKKLRAKAWAALSEITIADQVGPARRAYSLMQEALEVAQKRMILYNRYKKDVTARNQDERLKVRKAIAAGLRYLSRLFKKFGGDLSLVLAAYNAGPSRVEKYGGIPPFEETVTFRNVVLSHYKDYIRKLR